jgi:hypothetical protein
MAEKGAVDGLHYDAPRTPPTESVGPVSEQRDSTIQVQATDRHTEPEDDGGIHL